MPRHKLTWNGVTLREQPPVVGDYCNPPGTGQVGKPCVYESAACGGLPRTCPRCEFPYCANHYDGHIRSFVAPVDFWKVGMRRLKSGLNRIAENRKRPMPPMGPMDGEL